MKKARQITNFAAKNMTIEIHTLLRMQANANPSPRQNIPDLVGAANTPNVVEMSANVEMRAYSEPSVEASFNKPLILLVAEEGLEPPTQGL